MAKRILIVEDEIVSAMALERMLVHMDFQVVGTITTGEDAILEARASRPDIVVMDIQLAGVMDGIDAASKIAAELAIPILFMTGYDDTETRSRAIALKPLGFMTKPIDMKKFKAILEAG